MSERRSDRDARIKKWASSLTKKQSTALFVALIVESINSESVRFPEGCLAPYWEGNGEPLIEGQKTWADEEENQHG